jgi:hypothetical protein
MSLSKRIEKLEAQNSAVESAQPEPEDAERAAYWAYVTSADFITELAEKANAMMATMDASHAEIVANDCDEWYARRSGRKEETDRFEPSRITDYFFELLKESLEGLYFGPLALPFAVADFWGNHSRGITSKAWVSSVCCQECGYPVPPFSYFGHKRFMESRPSDYEDMRCPLCGGAVAEGNPRPGFPFYGAGKYDHRTREARRLEKIGFRYSFGKLRTNDLMFMLGTRRCKKIGSKPS